MIEICYSCGKHFDSTIQGKLRLAKSFCSLRCANYIFPIKNKVYDSSNTTSGTDSYSETE